MYIYYYYLFYLHYCKDYCHRVKTQLQKVIIIIIIIFSGYAAQRGLWSPRSRDFLITHDAPQSVGLLWTSDQLIAETSTWQHTQQKNIHAPGWIRTHDRSRRAAVDLRLRKLGYWDRQVIIIINYYYYYYVGVDDDDDDDDNNNNNLTASSSRIRILNVETPCRWVRLYRRFKRTWYLLRQW
jgi:hypothetical protein